MNIEHIKGNTDTLNVVKYSDLKTNSGDTLIVGNELEYTLLEPINTNVLFKDISGELPCVRFFKNKPKEVVRDKTGLDKLKFNVKKITAEKPSLLEKIGWIQWYEWAKTIGGANPDYGQDIVMDSNGDIIIIGYQNSYSYGNYDIFVMKLNSWGEIIWQKVIGGAGDDRVESVYLDNNDNIYMVGYQTTQTQGNADYFVVKMSNDGELQWQKSIGGTSADAAHDLTIDNASNIYLVGQQSSSTHGHFDISIVKMNTDGVIEWQKTIGDTLENNGYGITNDESGNIYVVGRSVTASGSSNAVFIKMSSVGNIIWQKTLVTAETTGFAEAFGITYNDNHIYVTGHQNAATFGLRDYFIMKMDLDGNTVWGKVFGGANEEFSYSIKHDQSGNIYVAGKEHSIVFGESEYGIIKLNADGDPLWQRALGGLAIDSARNIIPDNNGFVYVVGYNNSNSFGSFDIGLVKMKEDLPSNITLNNAGINFTLTDSAFSIGNPINMIESTTTLNSIDAALNIANWIISNN